MNKRGNLFEMLLLERGFPSWNESLNLSRREKGGVVSRSRFPQEIVTHIRGQSPARHVLARSQFHRSFHTGWSVFLSSKLLSFRISRFEINSFSSFLRFIFLLFLFFLFQLSTRCVFHGRTIIRFLIKLSRRRLIFEICREFSKCFEHDRDNKRSDNTSNLWFLIWKCRGITMR